MKRKLISLLLLLGFLTAAIYVIKKPSDSSTFVKPVVSSPYEITMKQDLLCLMLAYPEYISGVERSADGNVYLVMKSGQRLIYDDKNTKNADQRMANPDLQDMLEQPYPLTTDCKLMEKDFDPGRVRMYSLLKEVYGSNRQQIEKQLGNVNVGGRSLQFAKNNAAGTALKAAMTEVAALAKSNSRVGAAAFPSSGTYNYRVISGTNRLSPHAFGIAIDLARDSRDYWQWATREQGQKRLDTYPKEIVEIFEKNNFVWGGKWGHFDILHFEYRPEIILKARYFGEGSNSAEEWYKGAPCEDTLVKEYINKIEEALKLH